MRPTRVVPALGQSCANNSSTGGALTFLGAFMEGFLAGRPVTSRTLFNSNWSRLRTAMPPYLDSSWISRNALTPFPGGLCRPCFATWDAQNNFHNVDTRLGTPRPCLVLRWRHIRTNLELHRSSRGRWSFCGGSSRRIMGFLP